MADDVTDLRLAHLSRRDRDVLRRFAGGTTLAERLDPRVAEGLPHRMRDPFPALCMIAAQGRQEARYLARVAPWLLVPEVTGGP